MVTNTRDWHIKINDGSTTRRLRLLRTGEGLVWRVREESMTPRVSENATTLSFDSLPADRALAFAMDDWSWGLGLDRFLVRTEGPGYYARFRNGTDVDASSPNRLRHGPKPSSIGTPAAAPVQYIFFDDKVYTVTGSHLYSWDGSTFTLETTQSAFTRGATVFNSLLYIPRGPGTAYSTWDGSAFDASPSPSDPGGASGKITHFAAVGNRLWAAHDSNRVSFITELSSAWEGITGGTAGIRIGDGHAITNLFEMSGLLFIATENSLYVMDGDNVPHDIARHWKAAPSTDNFNSIASSGGDAFLVNGYSPRLWRVTASDFETFQSQETGPLVDTQRRPVNLDAPASLDSVALNQQFVVALGQILTGEDGILKGVDRGGSAITWSPFSSITAASDSPIGIFQVSGDESMYVYVHDSGGDVVRIPLDIWGSSNSDVPEYSDTWTMRTPTYTANLSTWDKIWWRLRIKVKKVGSGTTATLVIAAESDSFGPDTIGTIGSGDTDDEYTFALPDSLFGQEVYLKFTGTAGNSNLDGIDLIGFSLEGALRPDYIPVYEFSVVATNKAEADFLKALRTKTDSITLTDRFDADQTVFILPGFPVEQELVDEGLRDPVRVYSFIAQETPPT